MTTEDDFQRKLDQDLTDWQTRLVFADWRQERNDPRAEGYRRLGEIKVYPTSSYDGEYFSFTTDENPMLVHGGCSYLLHALPAKWYAHQRNLAPNELKSWSNTDSWWNYAKSRKICEDAAAMAYLEFQETQS